MVAQAATRFQTPKQRCTDMRLLRHKDFDPVQRVACIAYNQEFQVYKPSVRAMVEEMQAAIQHGDVSMLKGAAQFIDRNTNYGQL